MKQLTQAIFKDAPDWVKSAAVDSTSDVYFYAVPKKELSFDSDRCWWVYLGKEDNSATYSPDGNYDTTDWQNSAIEKEAQP